MAHVDNLRRYFPAVRDTTYLDTGSFGLLPESCVTVMKDALTWQLEKGRITDNYLDELQKIKEAVREQLSQLFHAREDCFTLTDSTAHGVNIVLNGLSLEFGDEVVVTDVEHPSVLLPIFNQKRRRHISVRIASALHGPDALCANVESLINSRTRLIVVSHVSCLTGLRLPIEQLTKIAHHHRILILIDGEQGIGTEPLDLNGLGCDFYSFPGQKWLCAPDGTGALYIKKEIQSMLDLTYVGQTSLQDLQSYSLAGDFTSAYHAKRYEHSSTNLASWKGFYESLQMLRNIVGFDYAYTRVNGLTRTVMDELFEFTNVSVITPREHRGGLVHFRVRDRDVFEIANLLQTRQIVVKPIPKTNTIRVSPHFYNSEDDILRLTNTLKNI